MPQPPAAATETPLCAVCSRPVNTQFKIPSVCTDYPYGGKSENGEPLCTDHWIARCRICGDLGPRQDMRRLTVGWEIQPRHVFDPKPRLKEQRRRMCPACGESHQAPRAPRVRPTIGFQVVSFLGMLLLAAAAYFLITHFAAGGEGGGG